ncbi:thioredoxin family protein [Streptococcus pluranimalium]
MELVKLEKHNCTGCELVENFLVDEGVSYDKVNVEDNPEVAAEYGVMSVPVLILLDDNGNEVQRSVGFKPDEISDMLSKI